MSVVAYPSLLLVDFVYMCVTRVQDMCECFLFPRLRSHPSECVWRTVTVNVVLLYTFVYCTR